MCQAIAHAQTVCITTLRLYSVYGPYEEPRRFIPSLVTLGLTGKLPKLARPEVARDYIHVDDVTEAFIAATKQRGEIGSIYNVGTGRQTSLREAVEAACRIMNIKAVPEWGSMPNRTWDTDVWVAENGKIQRELGWRPRVNFEEGLRATVDWIREHPQLREFYEQQSE